MRNYRENLTRYSHTYFVTVNLYATCVLQKRKLWIVLLSSNFDHKIVTQLSAFYVNLSDPGPVRRRMMYDLPHMESGTME